MKNKAQDIVRVRKCIYENECSRNSQIDSRILWNERDSLSHNFHLFRLRNAMQNNVAWDF